VRVCVFANVSYKLVKFRFKCMCMYVRAYLYASVYLVNNGRRKSTFETAMLAEMMERNTCRYTKRKGACFQKSPST